MRRKYPYVGVGTLCGLFGKTRNAFYDHQRRATAQALLDGLVLALVADVRTHLPRVGTRKLQFLLQPRLGEHTPRVGRDYLFALLAGHSLLIRRKRRVVTTQTCLPLFRRPNLIEHLTVHHAEQVWGSNITYVRLLSSWSYLSLITDVARMQPHRPLIHHSYQGMYVAPAHRSYPKGSGQTSIVEAINYSLRQKGGVLDPKLCSFSQCEQMPYIRIQLVIDEHDRRLTLYLNHSQLYHRHAGLFPLNRRYEGSG